MNIISVLEIVEKQVRPYVQSCACDLHVISATEGVVNFSLTGEQYTEEFRQEIQTLLTQKLEGVEGFQQAVILDFNGWEIIDRAKRIL